MCLDCHACFKAASLVYNRRIIVDDARTRHVFEHGRCSCNDRWRGPGLAYEDPPAARRGVGRGRGGQEDPLAPPGPAGAVED
mmetsp:Transcript_6770/g.15874  ORF Transcript_6770/g.15874 Transcript_6770/m.15874 type:complete len:82 (-) Transcript_6770:205-450(-)|eukprot:5278548-Prymnesium_polylepis.1